VSYCYDFIKKFRKEGNFCGLADSQISRLEQYTKIVDTLIKPDLEEKFIIDHFSLGAATPLIPIKDERRADGLSFVTEQLKAGKKVSAKDIQEKLQICNQKVKKDSTNNEKPKKKEPYNATPQPGDYPAPPAPVAQTLKEKYGGQDQFVDANEMIPAPVKESLTTPNPSNSMGLESAPWNCGVLPCPDGGDHIAVDKIRGKLCDLLGLPCNQLEKKRCPVLIRQQKARETGFYPASEPFPGAIVKDDLTGGTYVKPAPMKITKAPEVVSFTPSQKQYDFIQRVIKSGEFETAVEFLSELVDRAMEQEGS